MRSPMRMKFEARRKGQRRDRDLIPFFAYGLGSDLMLGRKKIGKVFVLGRLRGVETHMGEQMRDAQRLAVVIGDKIVPAYRLSPTHVVCQDHEKKAVHCD